MVSNNINGKDKGSDELNWLNKLWSSVEEHHLKVLKKTKESELEKQLNNLFYSVDKGIKKAGDAVSREAVDMITDDLFEELKEVICKEENVKNLDFPKEKNDSVSEWKEEKLRSKSKNCIGGLDNLLQIKESLIRLEIIEEKMKAITTSKPESEIDVKHKVEYFKLALECIIKMDKENSDLRMIQENLRKKVEELKNYQELKEELESSRKILNDLQGKLKEEESRFNKLNEEYTSIKKKLEEEQKEKEFDRKVNNAVKQIEEDRKKEIGRLLDIIEKNAGKEINQTLIAELKNESKNENISSAYSQVINQITFSYDRELMGKEFDEFESEYDKELEKNDNLFSDPQKSKEVILFLVVKHIFTTNRRDIINSLLTTCKGLEKNNTWSNRLKSISKTIDGMKDLISIAPGGGMATNVLSKGLPAVADLLAKYFLTKHAKEFNGYLLEDEKSLRLLDKTYGSLVDSSQSEQRANFVASIFNKLGHSYQFSEENSVFKVAEIEEGNTLSAKQMSQTIDKLAEHLERFVDDLQQEVGNNKQKIGEFLSSMGEEKEILERDIEKLVGKKNENKISLIERQNSFQILAKELDDILEKSKSSLSLNVFIKKEKEEKTKEQKLLSEILSNPERSISKKEMESLEKKLGKQNKQKLDKFLQNKEDLVGLKKLHQPELENLQEQQILYLNPPK